MSTPNINKGEFVTGNEPKLALKQAVAVLIAILPTLGNASCWDKAASTYGIDPLLLRAIGWQESRGWSRAVGPKLAGGHHAVGVMQINTVHLPTLRRHGITEPDLFEPCINQTVGAWVLADCIRQFGEIWRSVGCYYAGPRSTNFTRQVAYVQDVQRHYEGYRRQHPVQTSKTARQKTGGDLHDTP